MSEPVNTTGTISQRTLVYAAREMLKHAQPVMVLEKFGKNIQMPKNKNTTARFRRPLTQTARTSPLVEGITPAVSSFNYEDVSVTLRQYGDVMDVTDVIQDTHEDPVLNDMTVQAGENIGRTLEALRWGVLRAGTTVFFANGSARNAVNTTISINKQRAVIRYLKAQKAMKITRILGGSTEINTTPIEASFVAICHTDCEADIRGLPGFVPVAEYGSRQPVSEYELGSVEDVRYVTSPDLDFFLNAGGTKGSMSGAGSNADVYPILFMGQEAWGNVALRGYGSISPTVIPPGTPDKSDPLGQRGYVGWKTWFAAIRLNETWMARLECAVTAL
jgi:N4-gp56 family major capsid protein